ncbi:MAG: type III pantothenate kinase [Gammaproteobacteria bacterium]|nr:type III pantothenate kinase [Gammaproteobacteria bacterium]
MSILLLDIGNSRIKWGFLREGVIRGTGGAAHGECPPDDLIAVWGERPARLVVSNVRGEEFAATLTACTLNVWNLLPEFITPSRHDFGVTNTYRDAEKLGADRWAALIAAHHLHHGAACIVDCGTAITIDTLSAEGKHLGGLILPGLTTMRKALSNQTATLPMTLEQQVSELTPLAQDTGQAILQGTLYAAVAAIERARADLSSRFAIQSWLITGGDAGQLMPLLSVTFKHEPDLVLQGLAIIAGGEK